jgi:hypothetical protein
MIGKSAYGSYTFEPVTDSSFPPSLPGKLLKEGRFTKSLKGLCWLLTGRFAPRASIDVMKVSGSLSDVACSLSYIYFAVE